MQGIGERIDETSLKFSGTIEEGDLEKLEAILRPKDSILYLDSLGGDAEVGLSLAFRLLPNKMTVIVDGFCVSSCANYLFTVGLKKEIRKGIVGFHGNITALLAISWEEQVKQLKGQHTDDKIKEIHQRLVNTSKLEREYFTKIGVDQKFFDRTQTRDKGMGDGVDYHLLLPKRETFEHYGIKNVIGNQDPTYGNKSGLNNIYN